MTDKDEALSLEQTLRLALEALEFDSFYGTGKQEAITAIKAALLSRSDGEAQTRSVVKDEPVGDNKVKQLVNQCTHRDIDGNWYVDGVQLVHATCDAIIKGTI